MNTTLPVPKRLAWRSALGVLLLGFPGTVSAGEPTAEALSSTGHGLMTLDWIVLGVYTVGMLLIGVYYSLRNKSSDDYLLGGRAMRPWMVGLSFFASFMSVLTYLAMPGEMIRYGPMMLLQVLAFPLIAVVVCWLTIP